MLWRAVTNRLRWVIGISKGLSQHAQRIWDPRDLQPRREMFEARASHRTNSAVGHRGPGNVADRQGPRQPSGLSVAILWPVTSMAHWERHGHHPHARWASYWDAAAKPSSSSSDQPPVAANVEAARRRWMAAAQQADRTISLVPKRKRKSFSATTRKRMAVAQRKRWAARKGESCVAGIGASLRPLQEKRKSAIHSTWYTSPMGWLGYSAVRAYRRSWIYCFLKKRLWLITHAAIVTPAKSNRQEHFWPVLQGGPFLSRPTASRFDIKRQPGSEHSVLRGQERV